jgi:hypothetical protein
MMGRAAILSLICLGTLAAPAARVSAAEIFYLDRDAFNNEYTGPVGPLVLSGEIAPGDYARLVAKIGEDPDRFLSRNKLILASSQGNAEEAMKIAGLVKSLYTEVIVGPLTGRCAGACFLIYVAAASRGTDGEKLLGVSRPGLAESQWVELPTAQAALLEEGMQASVRTFLKDNEVPADIVGDMFERPPIDINWLSDDQERELAAQSPAFSRLLKEKCGWSEDLEHAVYRGERPVEDLQKLAECRHRITQPEARKALAQALKDGQPPKGASASKPVTRAPRAENKTTPSSSADPRSH